MEKTYHFLAGLPRSGSTLLSALLNQHPDIYSSPQSDLLDMMYSTQVYKKNLEGFRSGTLLDSHENLANGIPSLFYKGIDKPVIIDKNRSWGIPYNVENIMPLVNPKGKTIITMRPILEVLASMAKIVKQNKEMSIPSPFYNLNFPATAYMKQEDAEIEYLMRPDADIDISIVSIATILRANKDRSLVVWFEDIISTPQDTMSRIYDFLEVPDFKNNFNYIKEVDHHDDINAYGLMGLHDVREKLDSPKTNPNDYLSDFIIKRYGGALDPLYEAGLL
jgi:sulfotransferase